MAGISGPWSSTLPVAGTFSERNPYTDDEVRRLVSESHTRVSGARVSPAEVRLEAP
jgi:hypothetical protein